MRKESDLSIIKRSICNARDRLPVEVQKEIGFQIVEQGVMPHCSKAEQIVKIPRGVVAFLVFVTKSEYQCILDQVLCELLQKSPNQVLRLDYYRYVKRYLENKKKRIRVKSKTRRQIEMCLEFAILHEVGHFVWSLASDSIRERFEKYIKEKEQYERMEGILRGFTHNRASWHTTRMLLDVAQGAYIKRLKSRIDTEKSEEARDFLGNLSTLDGEEFTKYNLEEAFADTYSVEWMLSKYEGRKIDQLKGARKTINSVSKCIMATIYHSIIDWNVESAWIYDEDQSEEVTRELEIDSGQMLWNAMITYIYRLINCRENCISESPYGFWGKFYVLIGETVIRETKSIDKMMDLCSRNNAFEKFMEYRKIEKEEREKIEPLLNDIHRLALNVCGME